MKKFRVVVAGCGSMANTWVEYALSREDTEIASFVDINPDAAISMKEKFGINCDVYTDISEAILRANANLVFDITIPDSHKSVVNSAISSGCAIMGEKPMASSLKDASEMVAAIKKSGKSYSVMQNRRYNKNIRAYREIISSGIIGQPGFICADFFLGPRFGGFRDIMDSPLILDMAIHTFDQARFIACADPVSVYCHEFNPAGSWYKGNASAVCIFEFSNGATFCYRGSWCAEGSPTSWESSWRITGSKGTAIWDGENTPFSEVAIPSADKDFINPVQRTEAPFVWEGREGHYGCLDEMFSSLIEERKAETDCTDNIKSVSMVFAAIESSIQNKKIQIQY